MTTVVTGFHTEGWKLYGKNFLETFDKFWPPNVNMVAYAEELVPVAACTEITRRNRFELRDVFSCGGLRDFVDRNSGVAARCGREPTPRWKEKERLAGYSYRFDAVKFCKQLFYPHDAAQKLANDEILVWFDADVVTHAPVPEGFVEKLLGDADLCYLGRDGKHSEIGFYAARINFRTRFFLKQLAVTYATEDVFALAEWHSAHVFDHCLKDLVSDLGVVKNLTPGGRGNVFAQSPLAKYAEHLKGNRKYQRRRA